jgi:hypothetical protein
MKLKGRRRSHLRRRWRIDTLDEANAIIFMSVLGFTLDIKHCGYWLDPLKSLSAHVRKRQRCSLALLLPQFATRPGQSLHFATTSSSNKRNQSDKPNNAIMCPSPPNKCRNPPTRRVITPTFRSHHGQTVGLHAHTKSATKTEYERDPPPSLD